MLCALGAVLVSALALAACGSSLPGNAVARVGSTSVTMADFSHWLGVAAASSAQSAPGAPRPPAPDPPNFTRCTAAARASAPKPARGQPVPSDASFKAQCQQQYQSLVQQVMQFLVSSDWIQGEAADQGIKVSAQEVNQQFQTIKAQQFPKPAAFANFLQMSGMTMSDLLFRVRLDALSNKLRTKITAGKTKVTDAQVTAYYNQNRARFSQPERRDLRIVLTKDQGQAQAALGALRSGQKFSAVAKRFSIDQASKNQGGVLAGVAMGQQEKALDAAVFAAKLRALTGPVKTQFGYYVFQVQKITPATQQTLAQARPQITMLLQSQGGQQALTAFVANFRKKWMSRTSCRAGYVVQDCKNAPKIPPSTGLPPGAVPQQGGAPPSQGGSVPVQPQQGGAPPSQGGSVPVQPQQGGAPPSQGGSVPVQPQGGSGGAPSQGGSVPAPPQGGSGAGPQGGSGTPAHP